MTDLVTELPEEISLPINSLFEELANLGITHVGHGIIKKGFTPTAIYSHPEWARQYREERLYEQDPLRQYAIKTKFQIISWDSLLIQNKKESHILDERKRICSAKSGVLLSIKNNIDHETFVFGSDSKHFKFSSLYDLSGVEILEIMKQIGVHHRKIYF